MIKLSDVCMFQSGGTPSRKNSEYFNGDIPWVTTTALNGGTISLENANEWITLKAIEESAAKLVPAPSILVGTRVGVGKVAINLVPMSTSQDIISLLGIDQNQWNLEFLCKFISSKSAYLNSQARGATIKGIKIETLAELELPSYSIPEQHLISSAFNSLEKSISLRKQQLAKLDELVKSRFIELFGDNVPTAKLGDVCRMINGDRGKNYPSGDDFVENGVPFVNAGHLQNRKVDFCDMNYITEEKFNLLSQGKMQAGDILYCLRGSLGKHGLVDFERGAVASSLVILRCNQEQVLPQFLLYALETPEIELQLKAANNGSSQPNLSAASVKAYDIKLPTIEQQKQFVSFVEQTDKSKFEIQKSLEKLETLKKALMQKYFG